MPRSGTIVATATKIAATGGREAAKRQGFNWFQRNRHLCELNRGLQNLGTPCKGVKHAKRAAPTGANFLLVRKFPKRDVFTFFSLLRKEPKVAEGPRPSRLPENGSKLYRIIFFVVLPALVTIPVYNTTHFFGCFEPVRKGSCSADARLMFFENGLLYSKLTGASRIRKG